MKVTVLTATTGNPLLYKNIESVRNQTHKDIQHLIIVDGKDRWENCYDIFSRVKFPNGDNENCLMLPYSIGKDRWNGHRIYAAGTYMAEGDYIIFLDDDNAIEPTHIEDCLNVIKQGNDWAYSFRNIVDKEHNFLCQDNCESLGKWASVLHPQDFFIDVNCFFIPKLLAVRITPLWYRKFREPGQPEIDRVLSNAFMQLAPKFHTTYNYTVKYTVGNTSNSVQKEFFDRGNAEMLRRYNNKLPWKK